MCISHSGFLLVTLKILVKTSKTRLKFPGTLCTLNRSLYVIKLLKSSLLKGKQAPVYVPARFVLANLKVAETAVH
jgi:hypothetical protein